jgi:hypothetical protein
MLPSALTRRSLFGAAILLVPMARDGFEASLDLLGTAIHNAEAADAAYRVTGILSASRIAGGTLNPEWRAHRIKTAGFRSIARANLQELTPATRADSLALVRYYADRVSQAHPTDALGATRTARRRLREVFARPGAYPLDRGAWSIGQSTA